MVERIRADGGVAEVFQADLSVRGSGVELVRLVTDRLGSIDILVNNAGTMVRRALALEADDRVL